MNKGNIEMLEIKNKERIENPNPENNVYTDYIYSKGFGRVVTNLFWWLIEFFLFVYGGYRLLYPLVRQRKLNITVLYVTHDQEIALALSDRLAIMDDVGKIRQIGTPWEIFEQPADAFVFNFMGIANYLPVRQVAGEYLVAEGEQVIPWTKPEDSNLDWVAGFRQSDIVLSATGKGLNGLVKRVSFLGAMIHYLIEIDGTQISTSVETHEALSQNLMFQENDRCVVNFLDLLWFEAGSLPKAVKE